MHPRNMCSVLETACKAEKLLSISKQLTGLTMSITPDLGQGYNPLCQPKQRDIHSRWNRKMAKRWLDKEEAEKKSRVDQEAVLGESRVQSLSDADRQTNKLFLYVTAMESNKKFVLFKLLLFHSEMHYGLGSVRKEISFALQGCINLFKNIVKTSIL